MSMFVSAGYWSRERTMRGEEEIAGDVGNRNDNGSCVGKGQRRTNWKKNRASWWRGTEEGSGGGAYNEVWHIHIKMPWWNSILCADLNNNFWKQPPFIALCRSAWSVRLTHFPLITEQRYHLFTDIKDKHLLDSTVIWSRLSMALDKSPLLDILRCFRITGTAWYSKNKDFPSSVFKSKQRESNAWAR